MAEPLAERVVRFLGSRAPAQVSGALLDILAAEVGASEGAIFDVGFERPQLHASFAVTEPGMAWALETWRRSKARLARGEQAQSDGRSLTPIIAQAVLVGAIYLDTPMVDRSAFQAIHPLLADSIVAARTEPAKRALDAYLESTPPREIERDKILLLLHRHEWNLSRVSREMGITRTTMYRRLDELGITRHHGRDGRQRNGIRRPRR